MPKNETNVAAVIVLGVGAVVGGLAGGKAAVDHYFATKRGERMPKVQHTAMDYALGFGFVAYTLFQLPETWKTWKGYFE